MIEEGIVIQQREDTKETAESIDETAVMGEVGEGEVRKNDQELTASETEGGALPVEQDKVAALRGELEQALAKAEENWNLYLSARAEMENVRKRAERELQNVRKFALQDFIDALLPVKDSLEMGVAAASGDGVDLNKLREGSELTLKMLNAVLEKFGVQELNPLGAKFNPDLHQAMTMQPSEQVEPNTVLHVAQKGYVLNERLIRPAMVIVSQASGRANVEH
jgi:molecular chaperone GrpE